MPGLQERRFIAAELRAESDSAGKKSITGYAAKFNSLSQDLGYFRERVMPGAFSRTLREGADVRMLINHDPNLVLGRTRSNTLQLQEDAKGLHFRCDLPDTSYARDLYESVNRGDISQCSFGFRTIKDAWLFDKNGEPDTIRELHDVDLRDTSAVTYPAYLETEVNASTRSFSSAKAAYELRSFFPEGLPADVKAQLEQRAVKTKKVGGEELTADKFAYVGDPNDTSTWKLPIHDKSHAQNALARFNQTEGIPESEKQKVYDKIVAAAKKFGIHVDESKSMVQICAEFRAMDPDGDGDDDEPLIDSIDNVTSDASDFALCAAAALSEVKNGDTEDAPPALREALQEAKELQGLLQEFISQATDELSDDGSESNSQRERRLRLAMVD